MQLQSIDTYLKNLGLNTPIAYCPNPGNAGDALIAQATFQAFRSCGIQYQIIDPQRFAPQGQVVTYAGGGNLCRYYGDAHTFIGRVHRSVSKLIILPHTIEGHEDLLGELGSNVDIICREEISYDHVKEHAHAANVFLCDDMAFGLQCSDVLQARFHVPWHRSLLLAMVVAARQAKHPSPLVAYLSTCYQIKHTGVLNAFRTDVEGVGKVLPPHNYDLSVVFAYGTAAEYTVLLAAHHLLRFVCACRQLRTDRLHLAIAGALLGREVLFFANSYYKNRAIYDFSIKARFPNVHWMAG